MTKKKTTIKDLVDGTPKKKRPPPAPHVFKYEPMAVFPTNHMGVDNYSAALNHALSATRSPGSKLYTPYENIHYWNKAFIGWLLFDFRPTWRGLPAKVYVLKTSAEAEAKAQEINFDQTDDEAASAAVQDHAPPEEVVEKKKEKKRGWFTRFFLGD